MRQKLFIALVAFLSGVLLHWTLNTDRISEAMAVEGLAGDSSSESSSSANAPLNATLGHSATATTRQFDILNSDASPFVKSLAIINLIADCPTGEFPYLWEATDQLGRYQRRDVRAALMAEWGYRAPEASLKFLAEYNGTLPPEAIIIGKLFEGWALKDPDAAMRAAAALSWPTRRVSAYRGIMDISAQQDPLKALELFYQLNRDDYNISPRILAFELFKQSPQQAIQLAEQAPEGWQRRSLLRVFADAMLELDQKESIRLVQQMTNNSEKLKIISGMTNTLARKDPALAFEFREELPPELQQDDDLFTIFSNWADNDPQAATAYFADRALSPLDWRLLRKVFNQWGNQQPQDSFQESLALGNNSAALQIQEAAYQKVVRKDLEAGKEMIRSLPEGLLKNKAKAHLAEALIRKSPLEALEYAKSLGNKETLSKTVSEIAKQLKHQDIPNALDFFHSAALDAPIKTQAYGEILDTWFDQSPELAMEWLVQNDQLDRHADLLNRRLHDAAQLDPPWAAALIEALEVDETKRPWLVSRIADSWARTDLEGAQNWASSLTLAADQNTALNQIAKEYARIAPSKAMLWYTTASRDTRAYHGNVFSTIITEWYAQSPDQAVSYLSAQGDSNEWQQAFRDVAKNAYEASPEKAESIAEKLPKGSNRNQLIDSLIDRSVHQDPAYALRLATLRQEESIAPIIKVIRNWRSANSEEADRAFNNTRLSTTEKQAIEAALQSPPHSPFFKDW
jgi:hypothetical protein